eukprot:6126031-Karenia_brevis.AAC.1
MVATGNAEVAFFDGREHAQQQQQVWISSDEYPELSSSSTGGEGRWVCQKSKKRAKQASVKKRPATSKSPIPPTRPPQAQPETNTVNIIYAHKTAWTAMILEGEGEESS